MLCREGLFEVDPVEKRQPQGRGAAVDKRFRAAFSPAPYEQLAAALRHEAREQEARQILRRKERLRHRALGRLGTLWGAVRDATVGFGPGRALAWLAVLLAAGTAYFDVADPVPPIKPAEAPVRGARATGSSQGSPVEL